MLDNELLKTNLNKFKRVRCFVIVISIILCIICFILRDGFGCFWPDYCLFILPYLSATIYEYHKNRLLRAKELFIINKDEQNSLGNTLQSMNDTIQLIIKLL